MIKLEEIYELIEKQKEKCKPDTAKEIGLGQLINEAAAKFRLAIDDMDEEGAERLRQEIKGLKSELAEIEDLNTSKDSGAYGNTLMTQGKLPKLCKEFETQVLEQVDALLVKEEACAKKVEKAKDSLIENTREMRQIRQEIANLLYPLDALKEYTPSPCPSVNGSTYEHCKATKMTQFNFASIADQVRHAGGIF